MTRDVTPHRVDLIERAPDGLGRRVGHGIGPDGEEHAGGVALPHAGHIHLAVIVAIREVVAFIDNHLRCVIVQVEHHGAL